MNEHVFRLRAAWTGNEGTGTSGYRDYARQVTLSVEGKPDVEASAAPAFRGDRARWNPEDLLLASLSECHMLSYLHACVSVGVVVTSYVDDATAVMVTEGNGGRFREVILRPRITVADEGMVAPAVGAHEPAHDWCFIANSVNFPVTIEPTVTAEPISAARAEGPA